MSNCGAGGGRTVEDGSCGWEVRRGGRGIGLGGSGMATTLCVISCSSGVRKRISGGEEGMGQ